MRIVVHGQQAFGKAVLEALLKRGDNVIAVFVAPGGARAASAGFLIVLAADIAAMAPGTHMGAAHPVTLGGDAAAKPDETMTKKVAADLAAWARSLAERRKRNVTLAAEAYDANLRLLAAVRRLHEENPMLGLRGVRLGLVVPGLFAMQVRAIAEAACERKLAGGDPREDVFRDLLWALLNTKEFAFNH